MKELLARPTIQRFKFYASKTLIFLIITLIVGILLICLSFYNQSSINTRLNRIERKIDKTMTTIISTEANIIVRYQEQIDNLLGSPDYIGSNIGEYESKKE